MKFRAKREVAMKPGVKSDNPREEEKAKEVGVPGVT